MRLIDAKRLEANIKEAFRENPVVMGIMLRWIRKQPTADVAPVVHCRHCRSYNKPRLGWCSVHLDREGPDDFCGYGVRMDGDSDALD